MKAIEYFPAVISNRAYLVEVFATGCNFKVVVTDIIANTQTSTILCPQEFLRTDGNIDLSFEALLYTVLELANDATAKHIRSIEEANIAGMKAVLAARSVA